MTQKPADPRVKRTRRLIQSALIELTAERGFDAITVGAIARRAEVNRATFYRHFQDKYALVEAIYQEAIEQFASGLGPPGEDPLRTNPEDPPQRWVRLFEHIAEHDQLYGALLGRNGSAQFMARMRSYFIKLMDEREQLRDRLPKLRAKATRGRMPRKVANALMANLLMSTIAWWLESGKSYSPRQIASWFLELSVHGYVQALGLSL